MLIVGTTRETYHIRVVTPEQALVEVRGSDPRLTSGVVGRLERSIYGDAKSHRRAFRQRWIGFNTRMQIQFANCLKTFDPTISLRIEGRGWYYDLF